VIDHFGFCIVLTFQNSVFFDIGFDQLSPLEGDRDMRIEPTEQRFVFLIESTLVFFVQNLNDADELIVTAGQSFSGSRQIRFDRR
jgi:hypothetical protein